MKKKDKVKIIKWCISQKCGLGKIQTEKDNTNDLKELEQLLMNDKGYPHISMCSTSWYYDRDYAKQCSVCNKGFPYGYWKKFYERSL